MCVLAATVCTVRGVAQRGVVQIDFGTSGVDYDHDVDDANMGAHKPVRYASATLSQVGED